MDSMMRDVDIPYCDKGIDITYHIRVSQIFRPESVPAGGCQKAKSHKQAFTIYGVLWVNAPGAAGSASGLGSPPDTGCGALLLIIFHISEELSTFFSGHGH